MSNAREYKRVIAGITAAADAQRDRDRRRAVVIAGELVDLETAMTKAGNRAALTRIGVMLQWERALDALWEESWMALRPQPQPDPTAPLADLDALDADVEHRAGEVVAAVGRRLFRFLGR